MNPGGETMPSFNTDDNQIRDDEFEGVETLKTWRELTPAHYILKIQSFSSLKRILEKSRRDHYKSKEFEASGNRWKLLLYPKGDKKRNGSGHISLYLKLMNHVQDINALLIFFIFDHIKNKYLSIQDIGARRFTLEETESGHSRLVPLDCFAKASNGFKVNDGCVFGVEVFVLPSIGEVVLFHTLSEQVSDKVYIWNVEKLSELKETGHFSEPFYVGDLQWKLHLYSRGVPKVKGKCMSIYLCLQQPDLPSGWKIHVEFKISINDENRSGKIAKRGNAWFSDLNTAWGFPCFIKLDDLRESRRSPVFRDAMQIGVQFISMSLPRVKHVLEFPGKFNFLGEMDLPTPAFH
ncbi:hypothetical protein PTKIN_Ptkin02bG0035800 [Pterospermum kingtungense]